MKPLLKLAHQAAKRIRKAKGPRQMRKRVHEWADVMRKALGA